MMKDQVIRKKQQIHFSAFIKVYLHSIDLFYAYPHNTSLAILNRSHTIALI